MTSLVSGVTNVVLNIILIPRIGLYGPAISTVASYFIVFIIRSYDSRKLVPFDLKIKKIVVNNIILIVMVAINVVQPYLDSMKLSIVSLPILFLIVLAMNFKPLWSMLEKMIPAKLKKNK